MEAYTLVSKNFDPYDCPLMLYKIYKDSLKKFIFENVHQRLANIPNE